jgi:hypothetical protein
MLGRDKGCTSFLGRKWKRKKLRPSRDGYLLVGLKSLLAGEGPRRTFAVHSLVLRAFVGPRPAGMCCCHRDGDRVNNRLENLRWGTYKDNNGTDKARHGRVVRGERSPHAKLTEVAVKALRELHAEGERGALKTLVAWYGIGRTVVKEVIRRRLWKHVD